MRPRRPSDRAIHDTMIIIHVASSSYFCTILMSRDVDATLGNGLRVREEDVPRSSQKKGQGFLIQSRMMMDCVINTIDSIR